MAPLDSSASEPIRDDQYFVADEPSYSGTMTLTWQIATVEEGTRVDFIATNIPDGISAQAHAAGLASSLENLGGYLER